MLYTTEGFIKTISVKGNTVTFTLDPASPYSFEEKNDKKILLKGDKDCFMSCELDHSFKVESVDLASLIALKSNKAKVKLNCNKKVTMVTEMCVL